MSAYLTSLLILFFSIIPSVFNRNDSCCDWEVYESAGSNQGCVQPDINTEYACKMTCMGNAECFSFGWNGRAIRDNCALFYRPTRLEPGWEGDRQWVINRMGYCEVPCIYAFSARCGKYALNGVVRKSVAETKDCKLACMNETGCTGFDWWPLNDTDRRCLLNFRPSPLHDGSSSLHYEYMRTLCYMRTSAKYKAGQSRSRRQRLPQRLKQRPQKQVIKSRAEKLWRVNSVDSLEVERT